MARLAPRELLAQESLLEELAEIARAVRQHLPQSTVVQRYPDWQFDVAGGHDTLCELFGVANLKGFGLAPGAAELGAAGLLVNYSQQTARQVLGHLDGIEVYGTESCVALDETAQRSLELVRNLEDGSRERTLLAVLDHTRTAMGARLLRRAVLEPLRDETAIVARLNAVEFLFRRQHTLAAVREGLRRVADLERLAGRVALARAHPRDLRAIAAGVRAAQEVAGALQADASAPGGLGVPLRSAAEAAEPVATLIEKALADEPPLSITEGGIMRPGHDEELDRLRSAEEDAETLLQAYLEEERAATGIGGLKLRHNRVLGWYLEVTPSQAARVPSHFVRRQSLVGGERFTTDRLRQLDREIAVAGERLRELERAAFLAVRERVAVEVPALLALGRVLAGVDLAQSLALAATVGGYTRPTLGAPGTGVVIREGRHPVVEAMLPAGAFVPNDLALEPDGTRFVVLTGPNMAGKSTYLRQAALIVLMAQLGSFVPAAEAHIGVLDGIYCRVGASDNLARGESTFLVEMNETARILRAATGHSLVILDEIGRGTSTEDGRAIAWAVCEYLLDAVRALTLFATHLRELTQLRHPRAANFAMRVVEEDQQVVFLKRVSEGAADQSYGVHVAALAGVPEPVVVRAREMLRGAGSGPGAATGGYRPRNRRLPASLSAQPRLTYGVLSELPLTRQTDRLLPPRNRRLPGVAFGPASPDVRSPVGAAADAPDRQTPTAPKPPPPGVAFGPASPDVRSPVGAAADAPDRQTPTAPKPPPPGVAFGPASPDVRSPVGAAADAPDRQTPTAPKPPPPGVAFGPASPDVRSPVGAAADAPDRQTPTAPKPPPPGVAFGPASPDVRSPVGAAADAPDRQTPTAPKPPPPGVAFGPASPDVRSPVGAAADAPDRQTPTAPKPPPPGVAFGPASPDVRSPVGAAADAPDRQTPTAPKPSPPGVAFGPASPDVARIEAGSLAESYRQVDLFSAHELVGREVAAVDVDATTPLEALELLARWQRELRRGGS